MLNLEKRILREVQRTSSYDEVECNVDECCWRHCVLTEPLSNLQNLRIRSWETYGSKTRKCAQAGKIRSLDTHKHPKKKRLNVDSAPVVTVYIISVLRVPFPLSAPNGVKE